MGTSHSASGAERTAPRFASSLLTSMTQTKCEAVYLTPLGDLGPLAGDIEFLRRFLEAYLCIPCHVLDTCRLECDAAETKFMLTSKFSAEAPIPITSRRNSGTTQLLISDVRQYCVLW